MCTSWCDLFALSDCVHVPYLRHVSLSLHTFSFSYILFSLLKHYLDLYGIDSVLKVSQSLYCITTSTCHGVENFPRLWGMGISDAIFKRAQPR